MKLTQRNTLAFIVSALLLTIWPALANNLLLNGGFEETEDGRAIGWEASFTGKESGGVETTGEVRVDEANVHSGKHSLFIRSDGPLFAFAKQEVKLQPGVKYRLKAHVFSMGKSPNVSISVRGPLKGSNEKFSASKRVPEEATSDWSPVELEFTAPENLAGSSVQLRVGFQKPSSEAWFDDVTLELVE